MKPPVTPTIRTGNVRFTAAMITDLRSARAIIKIMKQYDPHLKKIEVPRSVHILVHKQIIEAINKQRKIADPFAVDFANFTNFTLYGVTLEIKK